MPKICKAFKCQNSLSAGTKGIYFSDKGVFVSITFNQIFTFLPFSTPFVKDKTVPISRQKYKCLIQA